jgi:hypothetical protein
VLVKFVRTIAFLGLLLLGVLATPILAQEATPEVTPEATATVHPPSVADCPEALQSHLIVGINGRVAATENKGSNIRSKPRGSTILATIDTGTTFAITGGPECHDSAYGQMWWWKVIVVVDGKQIEGWVSEGAEDIYWIEFAPVTPDVETGLPGYWIGEEESIYFTGDGHLYVYPDEGDTINGSYTVHDGTLLGQMSDGKHTWYPVSSYRIVGESLILTQNDITTTYWLQD